MNSTKERGSICTLAELMQLQRVRALFTEYTENPESLSSEDQDKLLSRAEIFCSILLLRYPVLLSKTGTSYLYLDIV
jgi:hypothetical protein